MNTLLILLGKFVLFFSKSFNLGSGSTWPGHIALETNPNFIRQVLKKNPNLKVIFIAGTNGKTTTATLLLHILKSSDLRVFQNAAGANLLNGIASSIINNSNLTGWLSFDIAIFEVDESSLPIILDEVEPNVLVLLNLFRDQLDRYGEVNTVATKWTRSLKRLRKTELIVNSDHSQLVWMAKKSGLKTHYFSVPQSLMRSKVPEHDADFLYCPNCKTKLNFRKVSFSSLGSFECPRCHFSNPRPLVFELPNPLSGDYNYYNIGAAAVAANLIFDIPLTTIKSSLKTFTPAFGRQERFQKNGKKIMVVLSKNPASLNRSFEAVLQTKKEGDTLLMVLNDRIPDGRDVSWIWDADFETFIPKFEKIFVSGDRAYDMGLRIKYGLENQKSQPKADQPLDEKVKTNQFSIHNSKFIIQEDIRKAMGTAESETKTGQTLFILPTYSAMLEVRKIITGRSIL